MKKILDYLSGLFRKFGVRVGFWFIKRFALNRIKYKPLQNFLRNTIDPIQDMSSAFTDKDPNDIQQVKEILCRDNELLIDNAFVLISEVLEDNIDNRDVFQETIKLLQTARDKAKNSIKC